MRVTSYLNDLANVNIVVPCNETYQIQELHLPVYHCLCLMLEEQFFGETDAMQTKEIK